MKIQHPFRTALIATLGVGVGLLIISSVSTLQTILLYVGTALFLSLGLEPVISWLVRRGFRRWVAVLTTIIAVLAAFAGIVLMVVPIIVGQVSQLVKQIQRLIDRGDLDDPVTTVKDWMHEVFPLLNVDEVFGYVQDWYDTLDLGTIGTTVGESLIAIGGALIAGFTGAFIVLILTIYFTASTPSLKAAVYQLVPASKRERFIDLSEQITDSVGFYVIGQASLGVINGVLSAIFLSIIGAPFPAVLAVVAFFFSLIPLVGTLTGSTIIVLVCLIPGLGSPGTALTALIYYAIYMQLEAYLLSPRIMNRAVSIPGAVVVIAALAGGSLLGLLGALIAIPVAASILIIYRQVVIPRQNER
ncbi:AI-2E family transporter [Microbacterium sp. zg.Y1090]|uniref:AI-2E family transporter n=1 Tax=Microbacterium TaxID=33882 RepID=UPI00214BF04D|nr:MULTISPECIES: AI-2E family transporter [unclassified Microbacterium]MCR2811657.1 AI-2E family transporter [Microbacterium sp. zg.Y1084]MCR2818905.1 AI-2E family transporter [Microbacterium sp. zg.Y1090]MDL5486996.1 AI-2E family transporter [Microbacterium sp. zg-Y1211]WIM27214.1 AI-2E family transporter [Microbacterium sp. zg-Y1090]